MPSLPRIRRTRPRGFAEAVAARPEARVAELTADGLTWIHLDPPIDPETVNALRARFGWHPLDVEDVLSKRQRPKVDDYVDDGYLFGVLHFPAYDKNIQRLNAGELDFFLGPDYLVTISNVELLPVTRLFTRLQEDQRLREQLFGKGSGRLLYEVLDDLFDYCFPILDKIAYKLDSIEDDIEDRRPEELELYFDDLVDASERIWDLLDNYKEVVEALESTNESVISHRQNDVIRILTVFSATLLPLTLLASVFGMNVAFPGHDTAHAFWVIVAVMVAASAALLGFFRWKRWL